MKSLSVQKDNCITNDKNPSGWFDYEIDMDTPYFNSDRRLLSLNQYIVAGHDSKLITGQYLNKEVTLTLFETSDKDAKELVTSYEASKQWLLDNGGWKMRRRWWTFAGGWPAAATSTLLRMQPP